MKSLRRICIALALAIGIVFQSFAGEMSTGATPPPPPPPETAISGEISTGYWGEISTPGASTDSVTGIALSVLQSLLGLF